MSVQGADLHHTDIYSQQLHQKASTIFYTQDLLQEVTSQGSIMCLNCYLKCIRILH